MDKLVIRQIQNVSGRLSGTYTDAVCSELVPHCYMLESAYHKMLVEDNKRCCQKPLLETHYIERKSKNIPNERKSLKQYIIGPFMLFGLALRVKG